MSDQDRMKVMEALDTRAKCLECGKWNNCAMEEGKSASTCWCMKEPAKMISENYSSCLCRSCLRET